MQLQRDKVYVLANGDTATVIHLGKTNKANAPVTVLWHKPSGEDKTLTNYRLDGTHAGRDRELDIVVEWTPPPEPAATVVSTVVKTLKTGFAAKFILPGTGVAYSAVFPYRDQAERAAERGRTKHYEQLGVVPCSLIEREV